MWPEKIDFNKNFNNNIEFKAKVIIWHILIAKVFLDTYFEKYYINFLKEWNFDSENFLKSIWYIDIMLYWDNYTDRYSLFESMENSIDELLTGSHSQISLSLRDSIIWDIIYIIGKKDTEWNLVLQPYDLEILENDFLIEIVKKWIFTFLEVQLFKLKDILSDSEIQWIKNNFLERIKDILAKIHS